MKTNYSLILSVCAAMVLGSCAKSADEIYENQIYFDRPSSKTVTEIPISIDDVFSDKLCATVPMKTDLDVKARITVDESLIENFNIRYGEKATLLPQEYYEISETDVEIPAGSIETPEVTVSFKNLLQLDVKAKKTYVLPLTLTRSNVPVLEARAVKYYFLKGASLVNVVAYLDGSVNEDGTVAVEYGNYVKMDWKDKTHLNDWTAFTYEALVNVEFTRDGHRTVPDRIFCLMGSENGIIVRYHGNRSDTDGWGNKKKNYLGIVFSQKNNIASDSNKHEMMLNRADLPFPEHRWVPFTVTYDQADNQLKSYFDGVCVQKMTTHKTWPIEIYPGDYKDPEFYVGYGYNQVRWWPGSICEMRVWKRALTEEEISDPNHPYFVDPATAEDLVLYWKFNDGDGAIVKDYSGNGNNGEARDPIKWRKVSLPEEPEEE